MLNVSGFPAAIRRRHDLAASEPLDELPEETEFAGEDESDQLGLRLREMWAAINRNRLLIGTVIALALLMGIVSILIAVPQYRAISSIQIDQQTTRILESEDIEPTPSAQEAERFLQTQVDILRSRALAERVATSLGLFGNTEFLTAMGSTGEAGEEGGERARREHVLRLTQDNLTVSLPRDSRVVRIAFQSQDAELAARVANSFAENYITNNLQRRFDASSYSREFLQSRLEEVRARLENSEREMIAYARQSGLIDASAGATGNANEQGPRSITTANLVQLSQAYAAARANRAQAEQRWEQARATPLMSLPEVLSNPAIQELQRRKAQLEAQYEQDRQRRLEEYPAMVQMAASIRETERQITDLATNIRNSLRNQYLVAARQESALGGNVENLKGATLAEQDRGVRLNILRREVDTTRQLYDALLQRYRELSAAAGITTNNVSIVDRAEPPMEPVSPRPALNMALAGIGGLALALLLVYGRETFDDSVRIPEDVERKLGLPLLGAVPAFGPDAPISEILSDPKSSTSEAYAAIRTATELSSPGGLPASILLTSSKQSEGKSTTAYALARGFAQVGRRVLLVDADLRKPSLHRLLGLANEQGLANLLARQRPIEELVQRTDIDHLDFLACGPLPPNPTQLLSGGNLAEQFEKLHAHYDLVVVDSPPVLGLADAPLLSSIADATIFVIEANGAHRGSAKASVRRLQASHAQVLGTILTKFDPKKSGHGYGYGYGYGYSYNYGESKKG